MACSGCIALIVYFFSYLYLKNLGYWDSNILAD
jgi:hypothetical protein